VIQSFEKSCLNLDGFSFSTNLKSRTGRDGNGYFIGCNAAPFAGQRKNDYNPLRVLSEI